MNEWMMNDVLLLMELVVKWNWDFYKIKEKVRKKNKKIFFKLSLKLLKLKEEHDEQVKLVGCRCCRWCFCWC